MAVLKPIDDKQACDMIAWAAAENQSLEIVGAGSKRALGRPVQTDHVLDASLLTGIVEYEPGELILTARAATPMAEIAALLSAHAQMLSFEPPDWGPLLETAAGPTLGGVVACNLSGPRRVRAGAARDYFLGFSAVNGWGEAWKAGAKVVKNVTGYDMCKVQAGAYGTLSLLTEITLKVMPCPETSLTLLLKGLTDAQAIETAATALNSPFEVSSAAHLPASVTTASVTALRLEGPAPSVAFRADAVEGLVGRGERLGAQDSANFWHRIASVHPVLGRSGQILWRVCPIPSMAPKVADGIRAAFQSAELFYDWGGGLIWIALDPAEAGPDAGAAKVRGALGTHGGGHAALIRAPRDIRAAVAVFEPAEGALAQLSDRVKTGFDPKRILNPGRIREGQ